jgi:hypothetical protein
MAFWRPGAVGRGSAATPFPRKGTLILVARTKPFGDQDGTIVKWYRPDTDNEELAPRRFTTGAFLKTPASLVMLPYRTSA